MSVLPFPCRRADIGRGGGGHRARVGWDGAGVRARLRLRPGRGPAGGDRGAGRRAWRPGTRYQTLLGITGSGKCFTIADVIAEVQRPTLVLAPNKSLAAQLAREFREFFPKNRVEYFVSYYDYYQPEAYLPSTDTYIEKDSSINDEIDRLRHSATSALLSRRDVIIVASVSAIYGLGSPEMYAQQLPHRSTSARSATSATILAPARRAAVRAQRLRVRPQQVPGAGRHDRDLPGVRGARRSGSSSSATRSSASRRSIRSPARSSRSSTRSCCSRRRTTSPTRSSMQHGDRGHRGRARRAARRGSRTSDKLLEAQRLRMRTTYDLEMMREVGVLLRASRTTRATSTAAAPGEPPYTLLDYFPDDYLVRRSTSRTSTVPQLHGQYEGDRSRKDTLVEHGFRLPSRDGQPAAAVRGVRREGQPGRVHVGHAERRTSSRCRTQVVEQIVRPTGLIDPEVIVQADEGPDRRPRRRDQRCAPRTTSGCSSPRSPRRCRRTSPTTCSSSASGCATCTARSTRSSGSRSCGRCGSASSTCSSASTCCGRASTCPRCRSSRSSTPTRRASCARRRR